MKKVKTYILLFCAAALLLALGAPVCRPAGAYIVKYKDGAEPFAVVSAAEARRLDRAGLLEWSEPDREMTLLGDAEDEWYTSDKWDLAMVHAEGAFEQGQLGQGVRVGVLDSGISPHAELKDRLLPGRNYVEGADADDTADRYGHGTLVAGLIAGSGENGCTGAAPAAELVPIKITDGKAVMVSTVVRGIYGAIDDFGCDILNLSLGIREDQQALREAIDYAEEKGVVVVSAVGGTGANVLNYPSAYETVIGVGSVDRSELVSRRSNRNESVFLTAPGVNVKTTGQYGGYVTSSGNSFAVPFVSAAAAVLLGMDPSLRPAEIMDILAETATDRGREGRDDDYGWGIVNIGAAVEALTARLDAPKPRCAFLSASELQNNTDAAIDCTYLLAAYDEDGTCLGVRTWQFTLLPNGTAAIEPPPEGTRGGQFVYETKTMTPLAAARTSR